MFSAIVASVFNKVSELGCLFRHNFAKEIEGKINIPYRIRWVVEMLC